MSFCFFIGIKVFWGDQKTQKVFRVYSLFCTQGSLLVDLEGPYVVPWFEPRSAEDKARILLSNSYGKYLPLPNYVLFYEGMLGTTRVVFKA